MKDIQAIVTKYLNDARVNILRELTEEFIEDDLDSGSMLMRFANDHDLSPQNAENEFVITFNKIYKSNLKRLVTGYRQKNFIQDAISPLEYLRRVDREEDAKKIIRTMVSGWINHVEEEDE